MIDRQFTIESTMILAIVAAIIIYQLYSYNHISTYINYVNHSINHSCFNQGLKLFICRGDDFSKDAILQPYYLPFLADKMSQTYPCPPGCMVARHLP